MALRMQDVRIDTGSPDEEGCLVFAHDRLIAVLVQLSSQHDRLAGHWFIEAAFGKLNHYPAPVFPDREQAQRWLEERLASAPVLAT
jgi:hypothetical protein